jgi:SAM-dependent methyltransferase
MTTSRSFSHDRFLDLVRHAIEEQTLTKLTLGKYRGADATLKNLFVRPVTLKSGPHLTFLWRHATRDITKNFPLADVLAQLDALIGGDFLDAHLFTPGVSAQLECQPDGSARLRTKQTGDASLTTTTAAASHDRAKSHVIPASAPWLRALGVTNDRGQPREGMADKFRQIQKFAELLSHLLAEAFPNSDPDNVGSGTGVLPMGSENIQVHRPATAPRPPLEVVDMGCGKGYLTFALAALLGARAHVRGIEARPALVELCNDLAAQQGFATSLTFTAGTIADTPIDHLDVLVALHACDTATDDALAKGIAAGAQLLVVSPCCQKELRPQLTAPAVLADALQHGIFQERQAEFVTDALRAQLLAWTGYHTRVFEFISTEHTAKNLMIAAIKTHAPGDAARATRIREFARFYGIRTQRLAAHLSFPLS